MCNKYYNVKAAVRQGLLTIVALLGLTNAGWSVPILQLDILGGTYDSVTQTIIAPNDGDPNLFTVRALYDYTAKPGLANKFYLSAAIVPSTTATTFGSFDIGTTTYSASSGMVYGNPPFNDPAGAGKDAGDLASHGIFPTWYAEVSFSFLNGQTVASYNTQDDSAGPAGSLLRYVDFQVDIANLFQLPNLSGYAVHFDLYHESNKASDWDVDKFAPFSHDAQSLTVRTPPPPPVPDGSTTITLLGMAMLGLGVIQRRIKK